LTRNETAATRVQMPVDRTALPLLQLAYRKDYLMFAENQAGNKKNIRKIYIGDQQLGKSPPKFQSGTPHPPST